MASWKKVLVSGSSVEIASITSSATPSIASLTGYNVLMIDNTGKVNQITAGNFNAGLSTGSYSFTASAVNGGTFPIGDQAILRISGSGGLTTTLSTAGSTTTIDVSANVGNGLQVVSNTLTLNTGSTHFIAGVDNEVFKSANFVDSSNIDFTVTAGASVTAGIITGSVVNAHLQNSAVTITAGSGLTGGGSTSLGASSTLNVGAGTGITVNADDIQLKNAGSLTNNTITKWDSGNGQLINSGLTDDGTALNIARNTGVTGWLNVTGAITGSTISSSGTLSGLTISSGNTITAGTNIFAPTGYIQAGTLSPPGPNTIGTIQGQIGFFNTLSTTGNLTVTGDTALTGNLTVAGTASFQNTTSLLVADKFVLLASGSTSLTDGGIIVAYNAAGSGSAIFLEAGTAGSTGTYGRFAVAYDVASGVSTQAADEFVVTAKTAASPPPGTPTWGGATNGYGNIHVNSANGDIFIYS
jgi:hypothetical protein